MRAIATEPDLEMLHVCQNCYRKKKRNDKTKSWCLRYGVGVWLSLRCSCSSGGWTECPDSQRAALFHQQHHWSQRNEWNRQRNHFAGMRVWGSCVPKMIFVDVFVFFHTWTRCGCSWAHYCTCQIYFYFMLFLWWTSTSLEGRAQLHLYVYGNPVFKRKKKKKRTISHPRSEQLNNRMVIGDRSWIFVYLVLWFVKRTTLLRFRRKQNGYRFHLMINI